MTDDSLLGRLAEEFTQRVREGRLPDIEEYAGCHPELADRIRWLFPTLLMLEGFAQDSAPTGGSLSKGQSFGRYRIIRLLGKGGMGEVYEAEETESGRRVALKILSQRLSSDPDRDRFLREGRLAALINHRNCVYVYSSEEVDGIPVISMELLPGGTLKDIVEARGPLPVTEAVDAILQVIEGLAAGENAGILHRDIKPSNCFIDSDGTVKIGDFGLSISTLARDNPLSAPAHSFRGTPAFSSPEQLRGEKLDVRSDIYSVGATLYYLLTGKTPFEERGLVQLCAAILDRSPQSPRVIRGEIPRGLARIVLRCLRKRAWARYTLYGTLKEELLAYSSRIPTPAGAAVRFFAAVIDFQAIGIVLFQVAWSNFAVGAAILVLYFAILEGLAGASIGKMAFFLRVAGLDGSKPKFIAAVFRASVFGLVLALSYFVARQTGSTCVQMLFPLAVLYCVATRRNGFSGLHDLVSRTRVVHKSAATHSLLLPLEKSDHLPSVERRLGPYGILAPLSKGGNEKLLMGYDDILRRRVWIVIQPPGTPTLSQARRYLNRPCRLRWLNGKRDANACWDAYEAPDGKRLLEIAKQELPWNLVPGWLSTLVEELREGLSDKTLPSQLSIDAIWIRPDARLMLLDFPAPSIVEGDPCANPALRASMNDFAGIQAFLHDVARIVLGSPSRRGAPSGLRAFLEKLEQRDWQAFEGVVTELEVLSRRTSPPGMPWIHIHWP